MAGRIVVEDRFNQLGKSFDQAMEHALIRGAEATLQAAEQTVPRRTGKLAESLRYSGLERSDRGWRIAVYAGEWYGRLVEFPHKKRGPKRGEGKGTVRGRYFMRRAGKLAQPAFARAVEEALRRL